ncbi:MAG: hypothetical protein RL398_621 [Planctomycetota bacterium]|jgi:dTDP-4-amino-4,6-dideoxygalactose transaminase
MAETIVAIATCSDALELSPLWRSPAAAALAARPVWLGGDALRPVAVSLGLPADAPDRAVLDAATTVLLVGHGSAMQTFGLAARHSGARLVRWNAGQRSHDPTHKEEAERRLTDHLAHRWLCASPHQRDELRREGLADDAIGVVGSLWPAAVGSASPQRHGLWLALEHRRSVHDREALAALLRRIADAGTKLDRPVRAAATVLGPALAAHGMSLPSAIELVDLSAADQVEAARAAAAILTDSAGHQELAAALGVPCIVLQATTARVDLVVSGASRLCGPGGDLEAALRSALAAPTPAPLADALPALPAAWARLTQTATTQETSAKAAPAGALPSDGDFTGRTLGDDEAALAGVAVRSGTLNSTRGTFVTAFEKQFAAWQGRKFAVACSNGSAAMHAALAALELQPGDEVITTPITDMGALTPILYEGGVPVFADVDPRTYAVTPATIAAQITPRTRAIVVTHLFGLPAGMESIRRLAAAHRIPILEDCAQAFGATIGDTKVGNFGAIAAFSLQQGKHITSGEGGIVVTDDAKLARRVFLFVNKAWGYGDPKPDHYFPALNYRLTEVQGAVLVAQLRRLDDVIARRREVAQWLRDRLAGVPGLGLPVDPPCGRHVYWKFAIDVDPAQIPGGAVALGRGLLDQGIACAPRYVQKPAYACELFREWRRHPVTRLPLEHNPRGRSDAPWPPPDGLPGALEALERVLVLPLNERYLPQHCDRVADALRRRVEELRRG